MYHPHTLEFRDFSHGVMVFRFQSLLRFQVRIDVTVEAKQLGPWRVLISSNEELRSGGIFIPLHTWDSRLSHGVLLVFFKS